MTGLLRRQNGEKQIGCMSGFLHIFDRQQILARKRIHSAKRLPPSTIVGASPEKVSSGESQEFFQEVEKPEPEKHVAVVVPERPDHSQSSPAENENGRRISPVKYSKEMSKPDCRRTIEEYDNKWRPPSVIARLMGLEPQQFVNTTPALPRSASESRVSRDPVQTKHIDINNFQVKQPNQSNNHNYRVRKSTVTEYASEDLSSESSRTRSGRFFQSADITMHGEPDKKLKMRLMDEQFKDLTALKQILEVLQLKGLLHYTSRNFVADRNLHSDESSIHLKQQWQALASEVDEHRSVNDRISKIPVRAPTTSPNRIESNLKSCNSIIKTRALSIEIKRRSIELSDKLTPKKTISVHHSSTNRSPRNHNPTEFIKNVVTDDDSTTIAESIVKTPSTTDSVRSEWEGCRDGKRLLERCGKLLHSIAEMNGTTESPPSSVAVIPSPVSVLDSGFDKDESSSPSHSIDFKGTSALDFDEDNWSLKISPTKHEEFISDDSDFIYISEILRASQHLRDDSSVFFWIEKQLYDSENTSDVSKRHRKLVFDVICEILDRIRLLPPWKASIGDSQTPLKQIWYEFQKIREMIINTGDCLMELISGVLKKGLVEIKDWTDYPIETSEVAVDIERLIFKDLVSEAIGDLVEFSGECMFSRTRRRLVF